MAIKQLSPEQVRTMSLEEKDQWWLKNVFRGDMPQLTWRSALTGMFLGAFLALTNLYVGVRTGWSLGVGITSVILSFALFKVLARLKIGSEMTVLENNAMQSIATSAGYMNSPLFTSFAAFTMVTSTIVPMGRVFIWLVLIAIIGVLFAFPMKKRFINDEQLPFPEGMAAGVVMDALHESDEKEGLFKAKLLATFGALAALVEFVRAELTMRVLLAIPAVPGHWDDLLYGEGKKGPKLLGTELRELTIRWDTSIVFLATGGLMGIRAGASMLLGGVINYFILAPMLIRDGIITPNAAGHYGFARITAWAVWGGVACMTTASLYSFFSKPKVILDAFRGLGKKGEGRSADVLGHIELPIKVSLIGVPIAGAFMVVLGKMWFGIDYWLGALAIPLVFVFTLIAVNSTALTAITPVGALGKLTQLTYGVLAPKNITTNLMTAGITAEVSSNASNLLMDIKPGYMLGAKPRQQAVGHILGAVSGLILSVPIWYFVFIQGDISRYGSDKLPVPSALAWKTVAELLMNGLSTLHSSARWAVVVGAIIGLLVEISKQVTKGKFPLSSVALGLSFIVSFRDIWTMFLGSFAFYLLTRKTSVWEKIHEPKREEPEGGESPTGEQAPKVETIERPKPWYVIGSRNSEAICAGVIAGGSLMGIGTTVAETLFFEEAKEASSVAAAVYLEIEPNNAPSEANGPYEAGTMIHGRLQQKGDLDTITFTLPAKGSFGAQLKGDCKAATSLAVADEKGTTIAEAKGEPGKCAKLDPKTEPKLASLDAGKVHVSAGALGDVDKPMGYKLVTTFKKAP